jgi:CBS domain-containing protein
MPKKPTARNIMTSPVETIPENATLEKAAAKMLSERVSSLVVTPAEESDPFGIVSTTDIVAAFGRGSSPQTTLVGDVMTSPLLMVTPHVPVVYVARLMDRALVRHVAVFNGRDVLGIISSRDILKAMMPENAGAGGAHARAASRASA